jgi:leucyl-tRNA synthetase
LTFFLSSFLRADRKILAVSGEQVTLCNSGPLTGLKLPEARQRVMEMARAMRIGGHPTSSNLQDWLISRQRSSVFFRVIF